MSADIFTMITANFEDEIPVLHDFCVDVCVRGVHYYKVQPDVGTIIDFAPETDPISLMHDRYAIAGKHAKEKLAMYQNLCEGLCSICYDMVGR